MTNSRPVVNAKVTFLRTEAGGRRTAPDLCCGRYMPHIVVQPPDVRSAALDADGVNREPYQGVRFVDGPREYGLGASALASFELMYFPSNRYDEVVAGATFTIREGGHVVGFGQVEQRLDPEPGVRS